MDNLPPAFLLQSSLKSAKTNTLQKNGRHFAFFNLCNIVGITWQTDCHFISQVKGSIIVTVFSYRIYFNNAPFGELCIDRLFINAVAISLNIHVSSFKLLLRIPRRFCSGSASRKTEIYHSTLRVNSSYWLSGNTFFSVLIAQSNWFSY